jgi:hypothetical protein
MHINISRITPTEIIHQPPEVSAMFDPAIPGCLAVYFIIRDAQKQSLARCSEAEALLPAVSQTVQGRAWVEMPPQ